MVSTLYPAIRQASKVRVRLESDGSLLVQCGTQEMGSRTYSGLGQIAANGLGIPMSKVAVELGDTWLPDGPFFRCLASEGQHFPGGGYGDRETTHDVDRHGSRRHGGIPCRPEDGGSGFPRRSDPQPGPAMCAKMLEPQTAAQVTIVESRLSVTGLKLLSTEQEESDRRKKRAAPRKPPGASVKAVLLPVS
jgi:hypothetical protein